MPPSRRRQAGTLPVTVALLLAVLAGCTATVGGVGEYASGFTGVRDANVTIVGTDGGRIDKAAGNAISDVQAFWTRQMPQAFGKPYTPVTAFYSIDPAGSRPAPCTAKPADIRGNAFYCPAKDIVAWDRTGLFPELERRFGSFLIAMVLAHEWGHAIQHRSTLPSNRTIVIEVQADCYAGAWTDYAVRGKAPHFQIGRQDLDQALAGYLLFRDPVGANQDDRQAHGSGFDRISAFQDGFEQGVAHCRTIGDNRRFTEIPFSPNNLEDQETGGNLPYERVLSDGPKDIADYWASAFPRAFSRPWTPVANLKFYDGSQSRPDCDGSKVRAVQYCPPTDTIYLDRVEAMRRVYAATGDFGPMTLLAVAYGQAVRKRLGRTVAGEEALLGSICLAGSYAGDVFAGRRPEGRQLFPGDLDEAIQALLNFAGASGFFDVPGSVGFERVAAFRKGFSSIGSCT